MCQGNAEKVFSLYVSIERLQVNSADGSMIFSQNVS